MSEVLITEKKKTLFGDTEEFICRRIDRETGTLTVLYVLPGARLLGPLMLPKGTYSFGYFREDLNYNIYQFITPEGTSLATYFNISDQTRVTATTVSWRDLVVDILVSPRYGCTVLDEEELPPELEAGLAELIAGTRDYILRHHRTLVRDTEHASMDYLQDLTRTACRDS